MQKWHELHRLMAENIEPESKLQVRNLHKNGISSIYRIT
jgi:hypothetical protein